MQLSTDAIVVGQLMHAFQEYESSDIAGRAYEKPVEAPGDVEDAREGYVRNLVGAHYVYMFYNVHSSFCADSACVV
jgi:hypothetical protein